MCFAVLHLHSEDRPSIPRLTVSAPKRLHLADLADGRMTLCGLPLTVAPIGQYWEYLDDDSDGEPTYKRTIWAHGGHDWESCPECLSLRPAVLCSMGTAS